jgi:hypothetical protein
MGEGTKRNGGPFTLSKYVATLYVLLPLAKRLTDPKKTKDRRTKDATYLLCIFFVSCD